MVHQTHKSLNEVIDITKRTRLSAVAVNGQILALQGLHNEIGNHPTIIRQHARTIGVENTDYPNINIVLAVIIEKQGLGTTLALIITCADADRIHTSAIRLRLGMHLGIAVDLGSRGLENPRTHPLGQAKAIDRTHDRCLGGLDRIVLVVRRRGRAGEVVNLIHLKLEGLNHIVPHELKVRVVHQVQHIALTTREKVVHANDLVALVEQTLTQMGSQKARAASNQDSHARKPIRPRPTGQVLNVHICSNFIELTATRISISPMQELDHGTRQEIDSIEREVLAVFVDGVRVLGLPPSIGEIYGLLFISQSPLSLDDLVKRLKISKGSASQGLRTLKSLGAVRETKGNGNGNGNGGAERRTYYEPAVELKRLVGGFIREQIRPHLDSGRHKIKRLGDLANMESDPKRRKFLLERTDRLDHWIRNGGRVLPIIQRILGQ